MSATAKELCVAAVMATVIGAAAWVIGVSGPHSLFVAAAVMTLGAGFAWLPTHDVGWPERRRRLPPGTRSEVARLSWVLMGRKGMVTDQALDRLLAIAGQRLARHGVDLADPRDAPQAERLLGVGAYRVLQAALATPARPVRYPAFVRCLTAVEQLAEPPASARLLALAASHANPSEGSAQDGPDRHDRAVHDAG